MYAISKWLGNITQPDQKQDKEEVNEVNLSYHFVQAMLAGGCSYIGTACLSSLPAKSAAAATMTAYALSHFTAPLFGQWLEPYRNVDWIPTLGQAVHITICFRTANVIVRTCGGQSFSYPATVVQIACWLSSVIILKGGLRVWRRQLKPDVLEIDVMPET